MSVSTLAYQETIRGRVKSKQLNLLSHHPLRYTLEQIASKNIQAKNRNSKHESYKVEGVINFSVSHGTLALLVLCKNSR